MADPDVPALALKALASQLASAGSAEVARSEGFTAGMQMQQQRMTDNAAADRWGKTLETLERVVDKVLDRLDAAELRKAAENNPPPGREPGKLKEGSHAHILAALSKRPPADEGAKILSAAGVTQANFPAILDEIRKGPGWAEFLDEDKPWLADVTAALPEKAAAADDERLDDDPPGEM